MAVSGGNASEVTTMECLSRQCRGTSVGEEKMSLYSSTSFSICCYHAGEPYFEAMTAIFFLPCGRIVMKINSLVWEKILLRCFAVVKEITGGGNTSGIMYNLFPKVIKIAQGLDSYTTCRFQKYGWPNNTSQRVEPSQSSSSMKGLML